MTAELEDKYATWDGPYLLGALTGPERQEYEAHLRTCAACQAAIAELSGLPGLLAQVPDAAAVELLEPVDAPPPGVVRSLAAHVERKRRRQRWLTAGGALVAAAAAVLVAVPVALNARGTEPAGPQVVAERSMNAVEQTPLKASFQIRAAGKGSEIRLDCDYPAGPGYSGFYTMTLATADGGQLELLGWPAKPGDHDVFTRTVDVPPEKITQVDLRSQDGKVLLLGKV